MKPLRFRSISKSLYVLVLLAIFPALAIILYSGLEQRKHSITDAQKDILLLTHAMAEAQQELTRSIRQMLATLSLLPEIQSVQPLACKDIFRSVLEKNANYLNIAITDLNGEVLASGKPLIVTSLSDRKHVREALGSQQFAVGEYILSRIRPATPAFAFAYPVVDKNNRLKAVLTAAIKLAHLSDFHDFSNLPEKSFVAITDHKGIRLFYYPPREDTNPVGKPITKNSWEKASNATEPGIFSGRGSDGVRRIFAFVPVRFKPESQPYLYVWTGIPQNDVLQSANAALARNLLLLILATALSLLIARLIGQNTLLLPIQGLVDLTRKFAQGKLEARSELKDRPDEFGRLAEAFHEMADTLAVNLKTLRESEEKLARSRKMESLGLLAGGVAHDLNNVLSGMVSYPDLLLLNLPEDSELRKPIKTIQESGHRAADIVQDLLTVARGVAISKAPMNVNDLVDEYLHSPEFNQLQQIYPNVTVNRCLETDLFNINGSRVHVSKTVTNLMSNAAEAVSDTGKITISTMNRYVDKPLKGYNDIKEGEFVVLSVSDDGPGISPDDLGRIFEPFYTKKVMGRSGTGLGLAVVWNIMIDHKGYIDVTTGSNGTVFELYFPMTRQELASRDLPLSISDYKGSGETILIVDDVESQRNISSRMLEKLGYTTIAVSSGESAIEYLKENTVDLILLDMIMDPGMNGLQTYKRIVELHPNQKALIISGFSETDEVLETQKLGAGQYIKKPVTLELLGLAVKKELEK